MEDDGVTGIEDSEDREGEAAADMFLNWVYRRTSDQTVPTENPDDACNPDLLVGGWEGFKNIDRVGNLVP